MKYATYKLHTVLCKNFFGLKKRSRNLAVKFLFRFVFNDLS